MEQNLWLAAHRFSFWYWKLGGPVKKKHPVQLTPMPRRAHPPLFILVHWRLTWINLRSVQFIQSEIRVEAHFWPDRWHSSSKKTCGSWNTTDGGTIAPNVLLWNKCPIHLLRSTVDKGRIKKCHKKLTLIFVLGWLSDISLAKTVQVLVHIQNHLIFLSHKSQFGWRCKHWCNFFNYTWVRFHIFVPINGLL